QLFLVPDKRTRRLPERRRLAHTLNDIVMGDDLRAFGRILDIAGDIATCDGAAGSPDRLVSSRMIRVVRRVYDVPDRAFGESPDCRENLVRKRCVLSIHNKHAVAAYLNGDISTGSNQHVHIALRRQYVDLNIVEIRSLSVGDARKHEQKAYRDVFEPRSGQNLSIAHFLIFA